MQESYLKLNDDKTEFLLLGSRQQLAKFKVHSVQIGTTSVPPVERARDLGVIFDSNMTMEHEVSNCVKRAYHSLRNLRSIRKYLTKKETEQLVHAFVTSKIDCCNALLYGLPKGQLQQLQRVQNAAARLVTNTRKYAHITPVLKSLQWLPVEQRLMYKILLITFRALKFSSPQYINSLIEIYSHRVLVSGHLVNFPWPSQHLNGHGGIEHFHQQLLTCGTVFPNQFTYLSLLTFSRAN